MCLDLYESDNLERVEKAFINEGKSGAGRQISGRVGTTDDFEMQFAVWTQLLDPMDELAGVARSAQILESRPKATLARRSSGSAPSRSWTLAAVISTPSSHPRVSVSTCRLST